MYLILQILTLVTLRRELDIFEISKSFALSKIFNLIYKIDKIISLDQFIFKWKLKIKNYKKKV